MTCMITINVQNVPFVTFEKIRKFGNKVLDWFIILICLMKYASFKKVQIVLCEQNFFGEEEFLTIMFCFTIIFLKLMYLTKIGP